MSVIYHMGDPGSPGTPDTILTVDQTGWASGAISIPTINAVNGGYQFKVPAGVVGAMCGITDKYTGTGYKSIAHALYFTHGAGSFVEYGVQIQSLGTYATSDVWIVYRTAGQVFIYKNGTLVLTRTCLFSGPFVLAGALYSVGDTITDAKVITVAIGTGSAPVGPIKAVGVQGAGSFGVVELAVSATGSNGNHGWGSAPVGPVVALGANYAYSGGGGPVGAIGAFGEQSAFNPSWGIGDGYLPGLMSAGFGYTGGTGTGSGSIGRVVALAANKPYAEGGGSLGPLDAFGAQNIEMSIGFLVHHGRYEVSGTGHDIPISGGYLKAPAATLVGQFGSTIRLQAPTATLATSMTIPGVMTIDIECPALMLASTGTVSGLGVGALGIQGPYSLDGRFGSSITLTAPTTVLAGNGLTGGVMTAALVHEGRYTLSVVGTVKDLTVWSLVGPAAVMAPRMSAWLVAPAPKLYAVGGEVVAIEHESYAINIKTGAVTRYTNFPFDNILRFGNKFFGVKADGIYELTGDTDNGAPIEAVMTTFLTSFGVENLKRVKWLYLFGRLDDGMNVTFKPDEGVGHTYQTSGVNDGTMRMHRARPGGKILGTYYEFTLANVNGAKFYLDRVEAIIDSTTRAM